MWLRLWVSVELLRALGKTVRGSVYLVTVPVNVVDIGFEAYIDPSNVPKALNPKS